MGCIINFQELDEGNILQGLYVTFAQNIFKYVLLTQTSGPWGTSIPPALSYTPESELGASPKWVRDVTAG
jgi:hypothetical protein